MAGEAGVDLQQAPVAGGTLQAPVAQEAQVTSSYDGRYSTGSYGTGGALQLTGSGGDS